jgi:hypothetical protein
MTIELKELSIMAIIITVNVYFTQGAGQRCLVGPLMISPSYKHNFLTLANN